MGAYIFKCVACATHLASFSLKCPSCGSAVDACFDLSNASIGRLEASSNPFKVFFDILPIRRQDCRYWLGRRIPRLIHAKSLGRRHGFRNLFLKVEGDLPTGSTKDRMASVSMGFLKGNGISEFVLATTGNTGASYAFGSSKYPFFRPHIFFYGDGSRLGNFPGAPVAYYRTFGDYDACSFLAKRFSSTRGIAWEGGFFNPGRREGLKLAYLESVLQAGSSFDWYFQAVSSGMGVLGTFKGASEFKELDLVDTLPKICAVQQDSCNPMVRAFRDGSKKILKKHLVNHPSGICKGILRGDPSSTYPLVYNCVVKSQGAFSAVSSFSIMSAVRDAKKYEGVDLGEESAAALASAFNLLDSGQIQPDEFVLVNCTSGLLRRRNSPVSPHVIR